MIFLAACAPATAIAMDAFETRLLKATIESEKIMDELCLQVPHGRPVDNGFPNIRFDHVPGAHRLVIANPTGGSWNAVDGYTSLRLLAGAGFYRYSSLEVPGPEGAPVPAMAFELTRRGYEAMGRTDCFIFGKPRSVKVRSKEWTWSRSFSGGRSYRVDYRLEAHPLPWADTPEFINSEWGRWAKRMDHVDTVLDTGEEIMLSGSRMHIAILLKKLPPRNEGSAHLSEPEVRAILSSAEGRSKLAPCMELPLRGATKLEGVYDNNPVIVAIFERDHEQHPDRILALEVLGRLVKAGLAKIEDGKRYTLDRELSQAVRASARRCLVLGEAQIESLVLAGAVTQTRFRGWASIAQAPRWLNALAAQFPGVAAALRDGYGVQGTIRVPPYIEDKLELHAEGKVPQFAVKAPTPSNAFAAFSADGVRRFREHSRSTTTIDMPGHEGKVTFIGHPGCSAADGTIVTSTTPGCGRVRASRSYSSGKVYAELAFATEPGAANAESGTNAALTTQNRLKGGFVEGSNLLGLGSPFEARSLKDGDVIGIAADLNEGTLYWHLNGQWKTGRPNSGVGMTIHELGMPHFIAVSLRGTPQTRQSWSANFGTAPFKFPLPDGYRSYGAR